MSSSVTRLRRRCSRIVPADRHDHGYCERMKLRVMPYVTVEIDDRLRRRLRSAGERLRLNVRAYLLSAADDVDAASDKVRGCATGR